jgi:hypothetical protein
MMDNLIDPSQYPNIIPKPNNPLLVTGIGLDDMEVKWISGEVVLGEGGFDPD